MSASKSKPITTKKSKGTRAGTAVPLSTIVGYGSGEPFAVPRETLDCEDFAIDSEGRIYYATRATDGGGDVNSTILNAYEFPPLASGLSPRPRSSAAAAPAPQYGAIVKQQSPRKEFRMSQFDFPPLPNAASEQEQGEYAAGEYEVGDAEAETDELVTSKLCEIDSAEYDRLAEQVNTEHQSAASTMGVEADWTSISDLMSACEMTTDSSSIPLVTDHATTTTTGESDIKSSSSYRDRTSSVTTPDLSDDNPVYQVYKASLARRGTGQVLPADEYGVLGVLPLLHNQPSRSTQAMLTFGYNYDEVGIDMSSPTPLYERLVTPLSDKPLMPPGQPMPEEYSLNGEAREKMPNINLKESSEDTVFFVFYNVQENQLQLEAAEELYARGWRFHKLQRVWMCRRNDAQFEQYGSFVTSLFVIFNHVEWVKIEREMEINLDQLDGKPDASQFKPKINAINGCFSWKPNFHANFFQERQNIGSVRPPPGFAPLNLDYDKHLDSLLAAQCVAMENSVNRQSTTTGNNVQPHT